MSHNNVNQEYPPFESDLEKKRFISILWAFKYYRQASRQRVLKTERYLSTLPPSHQNMLRNYREHLKEIHTCINKNDLVIQKIINDVDSLFDNVNTNISEEHEFHRPTYHDMEKVQSTLKQFARDWSTEGAEERQQCYQPIIDEIIKQFPPEKIDVSTIQVLVPGAGLGRLAYELAHLGFMCQGNEVSLFMLFASNFVLNKCRVQEQYEVYPWAHQFVNNENRADQIAPIRFPDLIPSLNPDASNFSMVAGDFLEVYKDENKWNCVATCFFIDCASNVVEFIETIYKILLPGGMWINLGPLLYHYSDIACEQSIEPSFEDLIEIIKEVGFEIAKSESGVKTKYAQNPRSMLQSEYKSIFLICFKPRSDIEESFPE